MKPLALHRLGGAVSDRHLGVLKTQAGELDEVYLRQWAAVLHVADLLERALNAV